MHRIVAVALLVASSTAVAQEDTAPPAEPTVIYKPITEIELGEVQVGATVAGPEFAYVPVAVHKGFAPMIHLRSDFNAEMKASTSQVE